MDEFEDPQDSREGWDMMQRDMGVYDGAYRAKSGRVIYCL